MPAALWTSETALAAWDMLRKYHRQLAIAGIDYAGLPRPPGAGELEDGRREEARQRARERARAFRDQQYRKSRSYVRCDGEGDTVILAFPYDPGLVAAAKTIEGRDFNWGTKWNEYPFTSLPAVIAFADEHAIAVAPDVRALAVIASERAAELAALPQVRLGADGSTVIIDAHLDWDLYRSSRTRRAAAIHETMRPARTGSRCGWQPASCRASRSRPGCGSATRCSPPSPAARRLRTATGPPRRQPRPRRSRSQGSRQGRP